MRGTGSLSVILALFLVLVAGETMACGESVFRIGKGVHYRAYSAPIPGTLLVIARTAAERAIAEQLRQAGHKVLLVDSDDGLATELSQNRVDVILAPADERAAIESSTAALSSPPGWVPVFEPGKAVSQAVRSDYGRGVSSDDDVRKYLKAIHQQLKHDGR
jgi:hypothetical protein